MGLHDEMGVDYPGLDSLASLYTLSTVYTTIALISLVVMWWDYLATLPEEIRHVWRARASPAKFAFLVHRYLSLLFALVYVPACYMAQRGGAQGARWCGMAAWWPWVFTCVLATTHVAMLLQIWTLYAQSRKVLWPLLGLTALSLGLELFGGAHVRAYHVAPSDAAAAALYPARACFVVPTSRWYVLALAAPTVLHHVLLLMTLYKTIEHARAVRGVLASRILGSMQKHHILFTLIVCLVNFASLVLSVRPDPFPYKLVNYMPALALTEVFVGKILLSVKRAGADVALRNAQGHGIVELALHYPHDSPSSLEAYTSGTGLAAASGQEGSWRRPSIVKAMSFVFPRKGSVASVFGGGPPPPGRPAPPDLGSKDPQQPPSAPHMRMQSLTDARYAAPQLCISSLLPPPPSLKRSHSSPSYSPLAPVLEPPLVSQEAAACAPTVPPGAPASGSTRETVAPHSGPPLPAFVAPYDRLAECVDPLSPLPLLSPPQHPVHPPVSPLGWAPGALTVGGDPAASPATPPGPGPADHDRLPPPPSEAAAQAADAVPSGTVDPQELRGPVEPPRHRGGPLPGPGPTARWKTVRAWRSAVAASALGAQGAAGRGPHGG